ncbi:unnamed protein product [Owenia fusiformis]|uniref:Inositol 1,4,5-trisphosphate receptor n=1 Tax=Owenia fusiformis TaxID=6347 RepID=A0A8J1XIA3_OWEFU|nr:unnamed protein product [Owenia fusiformis]
MAGDSLCVGDVVCLYSEESYGFVFSYQTSTIHSELGVYGRQEREKPDIPDPQVVSFKICVPNRYKLNKKHRKLLEKSEAAPNDLQLKNQSSQAKLAADAENEDNKSEQGRQLGKKLLYGQVIQLRHVFSGKFIHVSTTQTSKTESSNMQVELNPHNLKQAQFRVMPRYKVKAEGDIVQVADQVVLESVKSPGQFLHVSKSQFGVQSVYANEHELNLSVRQSGFSCYRRDKPTSDHENKLKAGVPIRLYHKEVEAYMVAEGLFGEDLMEDVHLRVRALDQNNPKTLFPSSSALTYWEIEFEGGGIDGGVIKWEQQVRIRHMCTRKWLKVNKSAVTLTESHDDPSTVFKLHPVIKEGDEIMYETYCRIEHAVTGTWLHALHDEYGRTQVFDDNDTSMAGLKWTHAPLKKLTLSEEMQYDDAFTIQYVEQDLVEIFNFMAGMVPFIQKLIKDKKEKGVHLNSKTTHEIATALNETKKFMIVNSVPSKQRQKLLRNLRIVELLVKLLQIPYRHSPDQTHLTKIFVEGYDVLYTYLMGDSRKNELYIAKHIEFFQSQISYEGDIGLNAAHMVMELVKDNRKIVDRITHAHIDSFVELLQRNKNFRYLDLLSVLCVCDGVSIPDNQKYIVEIWLTKGQRNCVFYTELGQAIEKDSNVVYVSCDNKRTWIALHDFVHQKKLEIDEEFLFLDHQLDLFGKLCYGRNEFAINVITQELGYLTWQEAFLCLTNKQLPDQLRAKYCHLIISLFVDVGENTSVLDRINLTFVYDDIGLGNSDTIKENKDKEGMTPRSSATTKYFPQLRDWIEVFLEENKDMTASLIGHNMLVEQVLRLVHYLVKYGYYGQTDDIKKLLGPLLSLLDGRNDKPYPVVSGVSENVLSHYRKVGRFRQSPETKAIVDAKHQAMEVLDLFFNFRFNTRLERFVSEFKSIHQMSTSPYTKSSHGSELGSLLYETFQLEESSSVNSCAMRVLNEMFTESSYFKGFALVDILLDLSHYEYDKMVTQSMQLLNRYYSAHDYLFKRAVQAEILITDKSCEVLHKLRAMLPGMRRLATSKMNQEQTNMMSNILDKMIGFCHLENEPEERHPMNQNILYNHEVVADCFNILSQEIDVRLLDQYAGLKNIFKKTFKLMKMLSRGNCVVQHRLFNRLDKLLGVKGAESEMAECLTEVFTGNKSTCLKILAHQVQKIMSIAAANVKSSPEFLDLLNAIVKVEELNLPLKRNQGYVMKYFMQYRSEVAYMIDQGTTERMRILTGGNSKDLSALISLVDLLATCAEDIPSTGKTNGASYTKSGENRFIESICQTIFSVDELLDVINHKDISNNLKRPYLRFLLWVYLNTAGGMIESGSGDMPHDSRVWAYIESLVAELKQLTVYTAKNIETVKQLLKKQPDKCGYGKMEISIPLDNPEKLDQLMSEQGSTDRDLHHGGLHYIFDAVMPFLQVFFRTYYSPNRESNPQEADCVDTLAKSLVDFVDCCGPLLSDTTHVKTMTSCMSSVLSASTLPVKVMEQFQEKYGAGSEQLDIRSDARKAYEEYYQAEEELNVQLNIYSVNFSVIYGGPNDVKTQISFPNDIEYTDIGGNEELPLGQEFQEHIKCFVNDDKTPSQRYQLAGKLVEQLQISASHTQLTERDRLEQQMLDIKSLQLLRASIHNEIVRLPDDWENDITNNKKKLKRIEEAQNALNEHDAILKVLPHLSKPGDDIIREVLAFVACMLFGGNKNVQASMCDYFYGTREERFFAAVKNRMNLSAIATKEKRSLMAQHQAKIDEAMEQAKALRKAMKSGQIAAQEILAANKTLGSTMIGSRMSIGKRKGGLLKPGTSQGRRSGSRLSSRDPRKHLGGTSNMLPDMPSMTKGHIRGHTPMSKQSPRIDRPQSVFATPGLCVTEADESDMIGFVQEDATITNGSSSKLKGRYGRLRASNTSLNSNNANGSQLLVSQLNTLSQPAKDAETPSGIELVPIQKQERTLSKNKVGPMSEVDLKEDDDDDAELQQLASMLVGEMDDLDYKDEGYIELVLRVLAFMCDGQNAEIQNYLREQPDNIKSFNLVAETARFLSLLYSNINANTIGLVTQLFNTLVEFTSGNIYNQAIVFDNKVCDYINFILRSSSFQGCTAGEILELKQAIVTLIKSLTEENTKISKDVPAKSPTQKDVTESLDTDSIHQVMIDCFKLIQPKDAIQKHGEDMVDFLNDVGFAYYHVLCRMMDLDEKGTIKKDDLIKTNLDEIAWEYYSASTLSIEILKDDQLQKIYFRVKDRNVLREEIKEKFKYEVDRTSPSNKLRDFMDWSKDIMLDIKKQQRISKNPLARFLVQFWWHFNIMAILFSFLIAIVVLVTWKEPVNPDGTSQTNSSVPLYLGPGNEAKITIYVLCGIHNLICLFVYISYFLSNTPTFPTSHDVKSFFSKIFISCMGRPADKRKVHGISNDDDDNRDSNLEIKFFSAKTFYYTLFLVMSVLGTVYHGYFSCFHLIHIVNVNQLLGRVMKAITSNGKSLLWVAVLGLIFFYIYALILFGFWRVIFDPQIGGYCTTMYECLVTVMHKGLIFGIFDEDYMTSPGDQPFQYWAMKAALDISFFILITTIGLNIIFGIIVDTFSELRDNKWKIDNDLMTTCFICSRGSYDFEHQGGGFEHHVKTEHNQWAYLFFFIHLSETRANDYTALEFYVNKLVEKENLDFFPMNRALALQHEGDSAEMKMELMIEQINFLVQRVREDEVFKQRELERKKQLEWEEQHKTVSGPGRRTKSPDQSRRSRPADDD